MFDSLDNKSLEKAETIQSIAFKLVEEQQIFRQENTPKEGTIFVIGSRGVGKSTAINKFFDGDRDREESSRSTLALQYSFGRRSSQTESGQKQILNVWELGSLENSEQLIQVPMKLHGLDNFSVFLMLDLSLPSRLCLDLESAVTGLKKSYAKMDNEQPPLLIVCGKYDIFMDFDPEIKKHICRFLRCAALHLGAGLLFYSQKISKLSKTLRDTFSHFGFGSPAQPFRGSVTDYNNSLTIWFGADRWEDIGTIPLTMEQIERDLDAHVKQVKSNDGSRVARDDPVRDPGFREGVIDDMRALKDEELRLVMKDTQVREKFQTIIN